jgi:hypothetical protein
MVACSVLFIADIFQKLYIDDSSNDACKGRRKHVYHYMVWQYVAMRNFYGGILKKIKTTNLNWTKKNVQNPPIQQDLIPIDYHGHLLLGRDFKKWAKKYINPASKKKATMFMFQVPTCNLLNYTDALYIQVKRHQLWKQTKKCLKSF